MCACKQGIAEFFFKKILQKKIHLHALKLNSYELEVKILAHFFFFHFLLERFLS